MFSIFCMDLHFSVQWGSKLLGKGKFDLIAITFTLHFTRWSLVTIMGRRFFFSSQSLLWVCGLSVHFMLYHYLVRLKSVIVNIIRTCCSIEKQRDCSWILNLGMIHSIDIL